MLLERHDPKDNWCEPRLLRRFVARRVPCADVGRCRRWLVSRCSLDIYPSDGTGCDGGPGTVNTCGSCGILYDVSYPVGARLL